MAHMGKHGSDLGQVLQPGNLGFTGMGGGVRV